jgi:hypothetical protein
MDNDVISLDRRFLEWKKDGEIDPDTVVRFGLHKGALAWADLLKRRRVVILAEGGSGKTIELQRQKSLRRKDNIDAWYCTVENLGSKGFSNSLAADDANAFKNWLGSARPGWFFLDSIDEAKLHHVALAHAMENFAAEIGEARARAHVVFAGRYTDWEAYRDAQLLETHLAVPVERPKSSPTSQEQSLEEVLRGSADAEEASTRELSLIVLMLGLDPDRIGLLAVSLGIADTRGFLAELELHNLWHFARRPLDLRHLIDYWLQEGRLASLTDMIATSILQRAAEHDPQRARQTRLSKVRVGAAAERLGAALTFSRTAELKVPDEHASHRTGATVLDLEMVLCDLTGEEQSEFINTALFDAASFGRLRFHNDNLGTIRSYLTAQWLYRLSGLNLPEQRLRAFLFAETYGVKVVKPSMRGVSAWLSIRSREVALEVVHREPSILISYGDPRSLPLSIKMAALRRVAALLKEDREAQPLLDSEALRRFATPDLAAAIRELWLQYGDEQEVRELLLRIIWLGPIPACVDLAGTVAFTRASLTLEVELAGRALIAAGSVIDQRRYAAFILQESRQLSLSVVWHALDELFPAVISVAEFLELIARVDVLARNGGLGFAWYGPRLLQWVQNPDDLSSIVAGLLLHLDSPSSRPDDGERLQAAYFPILIEAAKRLLEDSDSTVAPQPALDVLQRVGRAELHSSQGVEDVQELRSLVDRSSARRRLSFWNATAALVALPGAPEGPTHSHHLRIDGWNQRLQAEDVTWLLEDVLARQSERERLLALRTACEIWRQLGSPDAMERQIRTAAAADPILAADCNLSMAPIVEEPGQAEWRHQMEQYQQKAANRKTEERDGWMSFMNELKASPALLKHDGSDASQSAEKRLYALFSLLDRRSNRSDRYSISDISPIAAVLGPELLGHFRTALRKFWRKWKPTLSSERGAAERNLVNRYDLMALTSIAVDRDDTNNWVRTLNESLAQAAAGFATIELNGFPDWLADLADTWPESVDKVLIEEIRAEIGDAAQGYCKTLTALARTSDSVKRAVASHLLALLLAQSAESVSTTVLDVGLRTAAANLPDSEKGAALTALLQRFDADQDVGKAASYLLAAYYLEPDKATDSMMARLDTLAAAGQVCLVERVLPFLFGDRLLEPGARPQSLSFERHKQLVKVAYGVLKIEEDNDRQSGEVYSPDVRDNAQWARNAAFMSLINTPGRASFIALSELAATKGFPIPPERLRLMARERASIDSEDEPWRASDAKDVEDHAERPPYTSRSLMALAMERLRDLQYDLMHHDNQPGRALQRLERETLVQNYVARELESVRRGSYRVVRESRVADEKEPDIRLLSMAGEGVVAIELKVAESWTLADLETALEHQLCAQYLRARGAKHGVLLLVHQNAREFGWGKEVGKRLSFPGLLSHLQWLAQKICNQGSDELDVQVVAFDVSQFSRKKNKKTKAVTSGNSRKTKESKPKKTKGSATKVRRGRPNAKIRSQRLIIRGTRRE